MLEHFVVKVEVDQILAGQLAVVAALPLVVDVDETLEGERGRRSVVGTIIEAEQEADHREGWVAVELVAEEDRHWASDALDLVAGRLDHEAAAALGADQQAGQALGLKERRQVGREIAPGRGLGMIVGSVAERWATRMRARRTALSLAARSQ